MKTKAELYWEAHGTIDNNKQHRTIKNNKLTLLYYLSNIVLIVGIVSSIIMIFILGTDFSTVKFYFSIRVIVLPLISLFGTIIVYAVLKTINRIDINTSKIIDKINEK